MTSEEILKFFEKEILIISKASEELKPYFVDVTSDRIKEILIEKYLVSDKERNWRQSK